MRVHRLGFLTAKKTSTLETALNIWLVWTVCARSQINSYHGLGMKQILYILQYLYHANDGFCVVLGGCFLGREAVTARLGSERKRFPYPRMELWGTELRQIPRSSASRRVNRTETMHCVNASGQSQGSRIIREFLQFLTLLVELFIVVGVQHTL